MFWRDVRAVEGNGLENRRASNGTVGSNPTLSAKTIAHRKVGFCYGGMELGKNGFADDYSARANATALICFTPACLTMAAAASSVAPVVSTSSTRIILSIFASLSLCT